MMKKLAVLLGLMMCVFMVGCFGPSQKDEAMKMDTEICRPFGEVRDKFFEVWNPSLPLPEWTKATNEALVKIEEYEQKAVALKVQSDNKKLHSYMLDQITSMKEVIYILGQAADPNSDNNKLMNDSNNATTNYLNAKFAYENELSEITTGKSTYELTLKNFQKIHKGTPYSDVVKSFKMPGELTSSMETNTALIGHRKLDDYEWKQDGAKVRIVFENGKAHMMEQSGLK